MRAPQEQTTAASPPMADLARYASDYRIAALQHDSAGLTLEWSDGRRSRFHVLWLRDNCACSSCRHPQALERTYIFLDHPAPVLTLARIDEAGQVELHFQQGTASHVSRFTLGWLRKHDAAEPGSDVRDVPLRSWRKRSAQFPARVDWSHFMDSPVAAREWIGALKSEGIVLLEGVPTIPGKLLEVARRIGPIRASNFGEYYDVLSMPSPNASAYTAMGLELHTDLANWRSPPDVQLLFCLKNSAKGGESVFADGVAVAEDLRRTDPEAFELLATQPVEFRFHDASCDIRTRATVIEVGSEGVLRRIRFNNWLRAATVFPEELTARMYAALGQFWSMLRQPRYQLQLRLEPGQLISYDNNRVLHGRAAFDASSGERHLQGCYLNEEDLDSSFRILER